MSAYPSDDRFREAFDLLERRVEDRWEIPVRIRDVPSPFTGDLDGAEIHIDHDLTAEDGLFILVHLFGHTVQWNIDPRLRELGRVRGPDLAPEVLADLVAYEREACRYSLKLFHDAGIHDFDQWLADFSACDLAYLIHFYTTGDKAPFRSFWKEGQPLMQPLDIPDFQPTRWVSRWDGVVI
ncbi:MAG: hypothetical protein H6709_15170 [Kofleriaceae bacterium]|nr:hypothetical protein [Myxococcales bacterium]MCB9561062.1 hypothetical protein [Kofleriaceae bacterium]MCB9573419.1 hypothetical protein [Kofleriaceae bacterium]